MMGKKDCSVWHLLWVLAENEMNKLRLQRLIRFETQVNQQKKKASEKLKRQQWKAGTEFDVKRKTEAKTKVMDALVTVTEYDAKKAI